MARIFDPSPEQEAGWQEWLSERPPHVRLVAEKFPPWELFRLKDSGHRVTIHGFHENGDESLSMTVHVLGAYNYVLFERTVFGIFPDDLEPCELPGPGEPVGAQLTPQEARAYLAQEAQTRGD
jgi:hypothetical protein